MFHSLQFLTLHIAQNDLKNEHVYWFKDLLISMPWPWWQR